MNNLKLIFVFFVLFSFFTNSYAMTADEVIDSFQGTEISTESLKEAQSMAENGATDEEIVVFLAQSNPGMEAALLASYLANNPENALQVTAALVAISDSETAAAVVEAAITAVPDAAVEITVAAIRASSSPEIAVAVVIATLNASPEDMKSKVAGAAIAAAVELGWDQLISEAIADAGITPEEPEGYEPAKAGPQLDFPELDAIETPPTQDDTDSASST